MSINNLVSIWSMATKDELLTIISGILTVLLLTSGIDFLYYIGWAIGAWTIICFIGLFRNQLIKTKTKNNMPEEIRSDIINFLQNNFQNNEFTTQTEQWQNKQIEYTADIITEMINQAYRKGKNNE